jgi:hypothetical protein
MARQSTDRCSWCGHAIEREDGWRLHEAPGARRAAFCRLEHVVPWSIQGAHWDAVPPSETGAEASALWSKEPPALADSPDACAHCGMALSDVHLVLVRHRGDHRISDAFCSIDHLSEWAKAGGRWR